MLNNDYDKTVIGLRHRVCRVAPCGRLNCNLQTTTAGVYTQKLIGCIFRCLFTNESINACMKVYFNDVQSSKLGVLTQK